MKNVSTESWENDCKKLNAYSSCVNNGYLGKNCSCVCPPNTKGGNCEIVTNFYYLYDGQ